MRESVIVEDRSEGRLAKRIFQSEGKASKYGVRKGLTFAKNKEPRVKTSDCAGGQSTCRVRQSQEHREQQKASKRQTHCVSCFQVVTWLLHGVVLVQKISQFEIGAIALETVR